MVEVCLSILPLFFVEADVCHAQETLKLHPDCSEVFSNLDALHEVSLCLFHIALQKVSNSQLPKAKRHALVVLNKEKGYILLSYVKIKRLTFLGTEMSSAS